MKFITSAGPFTTKNTKEDDFRFVGTPAQVITQLRAFIEMGVSEFMLDCAGFPDLSCLKLVLEEVLPVL